MHIKKLWKPLMQLSRVYRSQIIFLFVGIFCFDSFLFSQEIVSKKLPTRILGGNCEKKITLDRKSKRLFFIEDSSFFSFTFFLFADGNEKKLEFIRTSDNRLKAEFDFKGSMVYITGMDRKNPTEKIWAVLSKVDLLKNRKISIGKDVFGPAVFLTDCVLVEM